MSTDCDVDSRLFCPLHLNSVPVSLPDHGHPCPTFNQKLVSPDKQCLLASSKERHALSCLFLSTSLRHPYLCRQGSWGIRGLFTSDSLHLPPKYVSGRSNHLHRALLEKTALFSDLGVMPWQWQRPEACRASWSPSPGHPAGPGRPSRSSCCMWARLPCKYLKQREQLGELSFQGSNLTEIQSEKMNEQATQKKRRPPGTVDWRDSSCGERMSSHLLPPALSKSPFKTWYLS